MKYYTWAEIREKVEADLDIQGEVFIRPSELVNYCNEAIDMAEAEILSLNKDYFLTRGNITLVSGQSEYTLPDNIYAKKIRRVIYNDGSTVFPVPRFDDSDQFEMLAVQENFGAGINYKYLIHNSVTGEPKMTIGPVPSDPANLDLWYLRNANRMTGDDADICDIPEFINFIFQAIKVRVYEKEGHPNFQASAQILDTLRLQMQKTLADAAPDTDTLIQGDFSFYTEMS